MPRPNDSPDVAASKTLAYILRHGAEKEGLHMRSDGLIRLADVLTRPKMKTVDEATVFRLVNDNAKKRFELVYGMDPSPPKPKKQKAPKKKAPQRPPPGSDAAAVDALGEQIASTSIAPPPAPAPAPPAEPEWKELEFVMLPTPEENEDKAEKKGEWFIRASQGHTLKVETTHLEPVTDTEEGRLRAGLMVHGTQWKLWDTLKETGLSRMQRQHVHLAPALRNHRITPRPNSTLLIFLSLPALLAASIPLYTSANGVVLTPGDESGVVRKEFWRKAVHLDRGSRFVVWENGKEVHREETPDEEEK